MCFDRTEQREAEMRLEYKLFCADIARQYLQQINKTQFASIKINSIIIIKKLFFSKDKNNKKKLEDNEILTKIRTIRQKN